MSLEPIAPARRRLSGKRVLLVMLGIVILGAIPAVVLPLVSRGDAPKLDDYGVVPAFRLVDERGQAFTEDALRGKITIVSFIFTRCDTLCPTTTMKMANLQEQTFDKPNKIKLVSFSVDPAYDTPPRLAEYAARYHANGERWRFVTGPIETMRPLVETTFMNSMMPEGVQANGAPNIAHIGRLFLVDANLHVRGTYDLNDITRLDQMVRDARYLARTQR